MTDPLLTIDDEERKRRIAEAQQAERDAAALIQSERAARPAPRPVDGSGMSPLPSKPTPVSRSAPMNAPPKKRDEYDPGFLDYLGGFITNGVAGIMDVGHRGRQSRNRTESQEQEYQQWLREQTEREGHNRAMESGLGLRSQGLDLQAEKEARLREKQNQDLNPDAAARTRAFLESVGVEPDLIAGMSSLELKRQQTILNKLAEQGKVLAPGAIALASDKARATAQATIDPKVETAKRTAEATLPYDLQKIREGTKAKIEAEREGTFAPVPGLVIEDEQSFAHAAGDPVTRRNMEKAAGAYRALMTSLDRMEALRKQHGAELPGEVQGEYELAKVSAIGAVTTLGETGVLNAGEYERYSSSIPSITPSLLDVPRMFGMRDLKADQLAGVKRALRGTVDARLYQWGARYDYDSLPGATRPPKAKPKASSAPRGTTQQSYDAPQPLSLDELP